MQLAMPAGEEEAAIGFYEGLLGLAHIPKPAGLADRGGCWFRGAAGELHLGVERSFRPARKAHPALLVEGLETLCLHLAAAGVVVTEDDHLLPGFARSYVDDPFGNRIELLEATSS